MNKKITSALLTILFLTITGPAQIKLKIPKLGPLSGDKSSSGESGGPSSRQNSNRQMVIDDGFTFFDAEPVEEYNSELRRRVSIGWHLRPALRMFGTVPNRSGFYVDLSKGGKQLARIRCEGTIYRKAEDPAPPDRRQIGDDYVMTSVRGCEDKTKIIKETGRMDVTVSFFNGQTDEEKILRKYKIDVHEAKRVRGLATAPVSDVSHFYIHRHAETPAAILFVRPIVGSSLSPNYYRIPGDGDMHSEVEIYFNISPKRQVDRLTAAVLGCSVNGSPVSFPGQGDHADQVRLYQKRVETAIYTDRLAPQYKKANEYMDEVSFGLYQARLPLLRRSDPANNRTGLLDKKGSWECSLRTNGEILRSFRWTVDRNGVVQHPEQASGNVNLHTNAYLISAEVPAGGHSYDHRLVSLPNEGLFYGLPWTSAEGKAAAGKVPKKGEPFHVPSTRAR